MFHQRACFVLIAPRSVAVACACSRNAARFSSFLLTRVWFVQSLAVNFPQFLLSDDVKGRIAIWVVKLAAQKPADRPSYQAGELQFGAGGCPPELVLIIFMSVAGSSG